MHLVMMGTGSFAEQTFTKLLNGPHDFVGLVTQPERQVGHVSGSTRLPSHGMKKLALQGGLPVLQPEDINTPENIKALKDLQADLLVVAAYGQILSREVLATAKHGGVNVHASLLPKYRGAAPIAWAIYDGETQTGVTIIRMSIHIDAGDILSQESLTIGPEETAGELEERLAPLGARLAEAMVDRLAAGPVAGIKQDKSQATKAPKLTKEHGLIDWTRPAPAVANQVRAMNPWPTAYTFLHAGDKPPSRWLIHRMRPDPDKELQSRPGFLRCEGNKLWVETGMGCVEALEIQPAGKKRVAAGDYLRGHPLPAGAYLGS